MPPLSTEIVGYIGSFTLSLMAIPQIISVYKTKSAKDLSYGMLVVLLVGYIVFLAYGILLYSIPIISSICLSIVNCIHLLILKYIYDTRKTKMPIYPINA
jgi:MtN3 and saliva related transmembrane protein